MSEPCRLRRGEGYAACADEGERSSMQKKKTEIITARMTPADKKSHPPAGQGRRHDRHGLPHHLRP